MPNPWLILAAVILWGASVTGAFFKGESTQQTKDIAASKEQQDKAVQKAKDDAAVDFGVAQQQALEQQKRELLRAKNSSKVVKALAVDKAATDCRLGDNSFSVLRDSLNAANSDAASPASASDGAVPAGDAAGRSVTGGDSVRSGLDLMDALKLSKPAQATD